MACCAGDWLAFFFTVLILFAAAITCLLSIHVDVIGNRGDYYGLLLITSLGMVLMASSADIIMLFLAIETTSIPLYILAGFIKADDKSTEAGLKYFLFGAVTSAVMLYGFSMIYGFTGETNLYSIAEEMQAAGLSLFLVGGIAVLVLVGFSFKIAAVPFHFWTPDVYEGAPTPITAYVSTASKAAGFAVLARVMMIAFPSIDGFWAAVLAAMAVATMTLGNVLALAQSNIKRLLAYSSIAHAGYALIGLVALSVFGVASMMFYLLAYVITNLAAFAIVILFARAAGFGRDFRLCWPQSALTLAGNGSARRFSIAGWYAAACRIRGEGLRVCSSSRERLDLSRDHRCVEFDYRSLLLFNCAEGCVLIPLRRRRQTHLRAASLCGSVGGFAPS